MITVSRLPQAQRTLIAWYKKYGRRDLPWRNTCDPYAIYLSEIMLQQTQVATVLTRYYQPFLTQFPTLNALARAPAQKVMKAWEGLGYYTRAAHLYKAAKLCQGTLPHTAEALMALPGIGKNTANAIACFAYGAAVPVMEANVKRVIYRLCGWKQASDSELWDMAETLLNKKHPFEHNQALMDIGALVCTKTRPHCGACPLAALCKGKNAPQNYPTKATRKTTPVRKKVIVVLQDAQGKYYVKRRTERFLGGLYGFWECAVGTKIIAIDGKRCCVSPTHSIGHVRQTYSHFTLAAEVYCLRLPDSVALPKAWQAVDLRRLESLPLSRAEGKIVELLKAQA